MLLTLTVLSVLLQTTPAAGQDKKPDEPKWDTWTPELQMRYASIGGVTMSPDGKYIAYVVRKPIMEDEKSEYRSQVWVAAADGSFNVPYTLWEHSADNPSFSPDSKYLAFTSPREDKESQIWVMRVSGGEAEKITQGKSGVNQFKWSPDGQRIAYTLTDPPTEEEEKEKKEKGQRPEGKKNEEEEGEKE